MRRATQSTVYIKLFGPAVTEPTLGSWGRDPVCLETHGSTWIPNQEASRPWLGPRTAYLSAFLLSSSPLLSAPAPLGVRACPHLGTYLHVLCSSAVQSPLGLSVPNLDPCPSLLCPQPTTSAHPWAWQQLFEELQIPAAPPPTRFSPLRRQHLKRLREK